MEKYTIEADSSEKILIDKAMTLHPEFENFEAVLRSKKEEYINQGKSVVAKEVVEAFEKADDTKRADFIGLVEDVKAIEEAKILQDKPAEDVILDNITIDSI